jgi:hypothetical protein
MTGIRAAIAASAAAAFLVCVPWLRTTEAHNPITTTVRFHREVAQILDAKCAPCHKPNGMAMPLQSYDQVRPWAIAIKDEILARTMPPWNAERGYGTFANDAGLTLREQEFLVSWIDGGTPRGENAPREYMDHSGHWMLGTPTRSFTASAAGASPVPGHRRYVVETRLAATTFVRAFDLRLGDTYARAAFYTLDGTGQYLGGWTPTHPVTEFPQPSAVRLPRNARILVDVLATGAEPEIRVPELALYSAEGVTRPVTDLVLSSTTTAERGAWNAHRRLPRQTTVFALRVDMSDGCDSIEVRARRPDGAVDPLLLIRAFTGRWQTPYVLQRPLTLPAGSIIEAAGSVSGCERKAPFAVHMQAFEPVAVVRRQPPPPSQPAPAGEPHQH